MAKNKYVACLTCGIVYDTEEEDYRIDADIGYTCHECYATFHKTDYGHVWCKVHEDENEEELNKEVISKKEFDDLVTKVNILQNSHNWLKVGVDNLTDNVFKLNERG